MIDNQHLFQLIHAAPGLQGWPLAAARGVAAGLIWIVPVAMLWAWVRGDDAARRDLLEMLLAAAVALVLAQLVAHVWPQPRPAARHLGTQYLAHAADPGLPSDHVTLLWSLGLASLTTRRCAVWGLPLLTAGLAVGWGRVFLGVHFPYDIAAAFPVALAGAAVARSLRRPGRRVVARMLSLYDGFAHLTVCRLSRWRRWRRRHKA